jgi:ATP-dependent DNA ligase
MTDEQLTEKWSHVRAALDLMISHRLAGAAAKQTMNDLLMQFPPSARKYIYGVFIRDLKGVGLSADSFSKHYPGLIPSISYQLCEPWNEKPINKVLRFEPKLDGRRFAAEIDENGEVEILSKTGKEFYNTAHIITAIKALGLRSRMLDGELMADDFNDTTSITSSQKPHPKALTLRGWVFDSMPLNEWREQKRSSLNLRDRRVYLEKILATPTRDECGGAYLVLVPYQEAVGTPENMKAIMLQYFGLGYEGTVAKDPDSFYEFDRNNDWIKVKPINEGDFEITALNPGDRDSKWAEYLGSISVKGPVKYKGKTFDVVANVASMTNSLRDTLWMMHQRGELVGAIAMVEFQEVSADSSGAFSLRFPTLLRLNIDKLKV